MRVVQAASEEVIPSSEVPMEGTTELSDQLAFWNSAASAPGAVENPALGMIERQQEDFQNRIMADRRLIWYRDHQQMKREMQLALQPTTSKPVPVERLPPKVVQAIFDSLVEDPEKELVERREERIRERMALHIEQLFTVAPPEQLCDALAGARIRIVGVESTDLARVPAPHVVLFRVLNGEDPEQVARRLDEVAGVVSKALARNSLLLLAPLLRFQALEAPSAGERRPQLYRGAKLERRRGVHQAMKSWKADMHWTTS